MAGLDVLGDWLRDAFTNSSTPAPPPAGAALSSPAAPVATAPITTTGDGLTDALKNVWHTVSGTAPAPTPAPVQAGQIPQFGMAPEHHDLRNLAINAAIGWLAPHVFGRQTRRGWENLVAPGMQRDLSNLLYQQPTMGEKYPQIFHPTTVADPNWNPASGLPPSPAQPLPLAEQLLMGQPATSGNFALLAKMVSDRDALARQEATNAAILGGGLGGAGGGAPAGMESRFTLKPGPHGGLQASRTWSPTHTSFAEAWYNKLSPEQQAQYNQYRTEGRTPFAERVFNMGTEAQQRAAVQRRLEGATPMAIQRLNLEKQRREDTHLPPMTAEETGAFLDQQKQMTNSWFAGAQLTTAPIAAVQEASKKLNALAPMVPQEYLQAAIDPTSDWEDQITDPAVKAAIDNSPVWKRSMRELHEGKLSDVINAYRQTYQQGIDDWKKAWEAARSGGASFAPPGTTGVTGPPALPGTQRGRAGNAAAVDAVIQHLRQ